MTSYSLCFGRLLSAGAIALVVRRCPVLAPQLSALPTSNILTGAQSGVISSKRQSMSARCPNDNAVVHHTGSSSTCGVHTKVVQDQPFQDISAHSMESPHQQRAVMGKVGPETVQQPARPPLGWHKSNVGADSAGIRAGAVQLLMALRGVRDYGVGFLVCMGPCRVLVVKDVHDTAANRRWAATRTRCDVLASWLRPVLPVAPD